MTKEQSDLYDGAFAVFSDDLYSSNEEVELDERYKKGEVIEGDSARKERLPDSFALLSSELNNERCHIRTPAQQAEWVRKKSNNQKALGRILLHFSSVVKNLIKECNGPQKMLLGQLKKDEKGEVGISYPTSIKVLIAGLLEDHLAGRSSYSIHELSDLIVDEYNLSYHHFIKPEAKRLSKEISQLKQEPKSAAELEKNKSDLFSLKPPTSAAVIDFEERESVSFDYASTSLLRQMRILTASIQAYKERLFTTNIRSCLNVSMQFFHSYKGAKSTSYGVLDLVSEASEGLLHAADMFVYGVSVKFTTYAEYWIRLRVGRYIKNNNPIRLPIHVTEVVGQVLRCFRERNKELNTSDFSSEMNSIPMTKSEVEDKIGKSIPDATWQVACNRQKGVMPYVRCSVNPSHDEGELSFDVVMDSASVNEDSVEAKQEEADDILTLAKKLTQDKWRKKYKTEISEAQYDFLICKHKKDMSFNDIALMYKVEAREVRKSLNLAIEVLQGILVK
jgi:RNA polymerase sigma factor (sigma-70 family)